MIKQVINIYNESQILANMQVKKHHQLGSICLMNQMPAKEK
jgi:hypothetical protein